MLKKISLGLLALVVLVVGGAFVFKDQVFELITADMYIEADTDGFSPGLAVGDSFPAIKASYQGRVVSDISEFIHDKGMVFIANRSADW